MPDIATTKHILVITDDGDVEDIGFCRDCVLHQADGLCEYLERHTGADFWCAGFAAAKPTSLTEELCFDDRIDHVCDVALTMDDGSERHIGRCEQCRMWEMCGFASRGNTCLVWQPR